MRIWGAPGFGIALVMDSGPAHFKRILRIEQAKKLDQLRHQSRPSRLVTRAESRSVVSVEVLKEQDVVPPVRVALEFLRSTVDRAPATLVP